MHQRGVSVQQIARLNRHESARVLQYLVGVYGRAPDLFPARPRLEAVYDRPRPRPETWPDRDQRFKAMLSQLEAFLAEHGRHPYLGDYSTTEGRLAHWLKVQRSKDKNGTLLGHRERWLTEVLARPAHRYPVPASRRALAPHPGPGRRLPRRARRAAPPHERPRPDADGALAPAPTRPTAPRRPRARPGCGPRCTVAQMERTEPGQIKGCPGHDQRYRAWALPHHHSPTLQGATRAAGQPDVHLQGDRAPPRKLPRREVIISIRLLLLLLI
jgi:hypothetical protein